MAGAMPKLRSIQDEDEALMQTWSKAGSEPAIEDMLQDECTRAILDCDGLTAADFRRHVAIGRAALRRRAVANGGFAALVAARRPLVPIRRDLPARSSVRELPLPRT